MFCFVLWAFCCANSDQLWVGRHGKSEKSSPSRFAFSNFRLGDLLLDYSASTTRMLDTFSMSVGRVVGFEKKEVEFICFSLITDTPRIIRVGLQCQPQLVPYTISAIFPARVPTPSTQ